MLFCDLKKYINAKNPPGFLRDDPGGYVFTGRKTRTDKKRAVGAPLTTAQYEKNIGAQLLM